MIDYDTLFMLMGILSSACADVWPSTFLPWPSIFVADFLQGDITQAQFIEMMGYTGPDYLQTAQCIVAVK